ncbi:MAG: hypothetical protein KatS3mg111_3991 [Pirellulaceae bacterium]|nr:MAG: hypothetical protein KatS3mg111_3991 [Pirellulaceae bacterium]
MGWISMAVPCTVAELSVKPSWRASTPGRMLPRPVLARRALPFSQFVWAAALGMVCICNVRLSSGVEAASREESQAAFRFVPGEPDATWTPIPVPEGLPESFDRGALLRGIASDSGDRLWVGAMVIGDPDSRRVAVAVRGGDKLRLWVDLDRDRRLTPDEEVASEDGRWLVDLDAEYLVLGKPGGVRYEHRPLRFELRWNADAGQLTVQTAGAMEGRARLGDQSLLARIEDRNANGRWFDPEDRLFVDLNGDGRLDRLVERLPAYGVRRVDGKLLMISGDARGDAVTLQESKDTGRLALKINLRAPQAVVESFEAILVSPIGVRVRVSRVGQPVKVPVGEYQIAQLSFLVRDGGEQFSYLFLRDRIEYPLRVEPDGELSVQALVGLYITADLTLDTSTDRLLVLPRMRAEPNLFLYQCRRGSGGAMVDNRMYVTCRYRGQLLGTGSSGFT